MAWPLPLLARLGFRMPPVFIAANMFVWCAVCSTGLVFIITQTTRAQNKQTCAWGVPAPSSSYLLLGGPVASPPAASPPAPNAIDPGWALGMGCVSMSGGAGRCCARLAHGFSFRLFMLFCIEIYSKHMFENSSIGYTFYNYSSSSNKNKTKLAYAFMAAAHRIQSQA